jgi:hypothetical protein
VSLCETGDFRESPAPSTTALWNGHPRKTAAESDPMGSKIANSRSAGPSTPTLGFSLATGLVRTDDGTLYVGYAAGDASLTGIWRIRPGGKPKRIIPLSAASLPNGMALDERTGKLYVADSARGIIWRARITGGAPTVWAAGAAYEPTSLLGANGVKLHGSRYSVRSCSACLRDPEMATLPGWFVAASFGDVVHERRRRTVQTGEQIGRDAGRGEGP